MNKDKDNKISFDAILVSNGFNSNNHYFAQKELRESFKTVVNQPVNIGHDSDLVIGSINDSKLLTDVQLREYTGQEAKHIIVNADIYKDKISKFLGENDLEALVGKVFAGKYGVSMECLPGDCDIVVDDGKKMVILPINDETVLLLMFAGIFSEGNLGSKQYKIGLYLKDINFVGMALTEKPANPNSKILKIYQAEDTNMSDVEKQLEEKQKQIDQFTDQVATLTKEKDERETVDNEKLSTLQSQYDEIVEKHDESLKKIESLELDAKLQNRKIQLSEYDIEITDEELSQFTDASFEVFCRSLKKENEIKAEFKTKYKELKDKEEAEKLEAEKEKKVEFELKKKKDADGLPVDDDTHDDFGARLLKGLN